jgi:hypothetical protein
MSYNLLEAQDALEDTLKAWVESEIKTDGLLSEVKQVITGEVTENGFKPPTIWIMLDQADMTEEATMTEIWEQQVNIMGLITTNKPEQGTKLSRNLSIRARQAIIKHRRQNSDWPREWLQRIKSKGFDPSPVERPDNKLFASMCTITAVYRVVEQF